MHTRLLSFFADLENALLADDPSPSEGSWDTSRTVNYAAGLARLNLSVRLGTGKIEARGAVLLQSYLLADGSPCLKIALSWTGTDRQAFRSIYSRPDTNWKSEARKAAAEWMAGPPAKIEPATEEQPAPAALAAG
jgi:hypothetical protein